MIVDGGYLDWRCLQRPAPTDVSPIVHRWSDMVESVRKDVEHGELNVSVIVRDGSYFAYVTSLISTQALPAQCALPSSITLRIPSPAAALGHAHRQLDFDGRSTWPQGVDYGGGRRHVHNQLCHRHLTTQKAGRGARRPGSRQRVTIPNA